MMRRVLTCGALLVVLLASHEAAAQGQGRPKAPKAPKVPKAPVQTASPSAAAPVASTPQPLSPAQTVAPAVSFRQFGSWLDDASGATAGEARMGIGVGYWRVSGGSQLNVPMLDAGYALTDRFQASVNVPFYRTAYEGTTARGLDDVYLTGKMTLIDPELTISEFGLAVSPVIEVLSAGGSDRRVHYAIPASVEIRRLPFRVFGSTGYFSRGSVFAAGAVEWTSATGYMLTAAVTQAYSIHEDASLDGLGVSRRRVDVTGSVTYALGQTAAAYVSVGRSLASTEEGGTALSVSGGLSFRFKADQATP